MIKIKMKIITAMKKLKQMIKKQKSISKVELLIFLQKNKKVIEVTKKKKEKKKKKKKKKNKKRIKKK